jgi:putative N6-adenine-specific DNA methylase
MNQLFKFFIIIPIGLESIAEIEIKSKWTVYFKTQVPSLKIELGGIEVECLLFEGLYLNNILKSPTRVLMRIDEFKCRDAPKLFNKISKIPWAKYLLNEKVNVEASSSESRLFDSRKIESATVDGIKNFIHSNPLKKKYLTHPQANQYQASVYIRIVHDICTVSLDTSGEILHKRGEKELSGFAPIRENIAFSLLFSMLKDVSESDLNLIDPMCGSGTFLIEAARLNHTVHQRDFSYHLFPIYIEEKDLTLNLRL